MIGPPGTLAYALETGPLLLVALDVNTQTIRNPTAPEDWHLGMEQLVWLEAVLANSSCPWKVVMAEHLVGGVSDPQESHWKGRCGITATTDGTPTAPFLGEQLILQEIYLRHGVDLFLSAHDHLVAWGLKDGIAYCIAGRASGIGQPWASLPWYSNLMDYDGDGVPEYDSQVTGTKKPGHIELTVDDSMLQVDYVLASNDAAVNGSVILSFELQR